MLPSTLLLQSFLIFLCSELTLQQDYSPVCMGKNTCEEFAACCTWIDCGYGSYNKTSHCIADGEGKPIPGRLTCKCVQTRNPRRQRPHAYHQTFNQNPNHQTKPYVHNQNLSKDNRRQTENRRNSNPQTQTDQNSNRQTQTDRRKEKQNANHQKPTNQNPNQRKDFSDRCRNLKTCREFATCCEQFDRYCETVETAHSDCYVIKDVMDPRTTTVSNLSTCTCLRGDDLPPKTQPTPHPSVLTYQTQTARNWAEIQTERIQTPHQSHSERGRDFSDRCRKSQKTCQEFSTCCERYDLHCAPGEIAFSECYMIYSDTRLTRIAARSTCKCQIGQRPGQTTQSGRVPDPKGYTTQPAPTTRTLYAPFTRAPKSLYSIGEDYKSSCRNASNCQKFVECCSRYTNYCHRGERLKTSCQRGNGRVLFERSTCKCIASTFPEETEEKSFETSLELRPGPNVPSGPESIPSGPDSSLETATRWPNLGSTSQDFLRHCIDYKYCSDFSSCCYQFAQGCGFGKEISADCKRDSSGKIDPAQSYCKCKKKIIIYRANPFGPRTTDPPPKQLTFTTRRPPDSTTTLSKRTTTENTPTIIYTARPPKTTTASNYPNYSERCLRTVDCKAFEVCCRFFDGACRDSGLKLFMQCWGISEGSFVASKSTCKCVQHSSESESEESEEDTEISNSEIGEDKDDALTQSASQKKQSDANSSVQKSVNVCAVILIILRILLLVSF